jgi:hypothetical protein
LAKERASEHGDEAPVWLHADGKSIPRDRIGSTLPSDMFSEAHPSEYTNRAWIPIASICSAICIAGLVFIFRLSDSEPKPIANLPPFQQSQDGSSEAGSSETGSSEVSNIASAEELLQSRSMITEPSSSLAQSNSGTQDRSKDSPDIALTPPVNDAQDGLVRSILEKVELDESTTKSEDKIASNEQKKPERNSVSESNNMANSLAGTAESKSKRSKGSASIVPAGRMLFAVYVDMDRVAFENNALDQIFAKHGIAAIEELAINDDQLRSLLTTGLAGSVSLEGNSIVLLKGKSRSIDKAVMEINSQYKDFPAIGMNVLMGEEVKDLERQFSTISVASAPASRRLTVKNDSGIFSRFSDGKLKAKKMPNNGGLAKIPLVIDDGESLMLLLIREVE